MGHKMHDWFQVSSLRVSQIEFDPLLSVILENAIDVSFA